MERTLGMAPFSHRFALGIGAALPRQPGRKFPPPPRRGAKTDLGAILHPGFLLFTKRVCVFCDGSVHDEPKQAMRDQMQRGELLTRGYHVIVIRYDSEFSVQIAEHPDVFGGRRHTGRM
jgi:hypothetical protein